MGDTGIYKITNLINEKVYIGKASFYQSRKRGHLSQLRRGVHTNIHLQRSWNKYGEENFTNELIEECNRKDLTKRENYWMNFFESFNYKNGYNMMLPSSDEKTNHHSEESKNLISKAHTLYTDKELIDFLIEFHKESKKIPTQRNLTKNDDYPNYGTYYLRFGSFKNALIISGLYDLIPDKKDFDRIQITQDDKPEIIRIAKEFVKENGRFMECKDIDKDNRLPHSGTVTRVFGGSLENLMNECGYSKEYFNEIEESKIIASLKKLYLQDGKITRNTIEACPYTRSYSVYVKRFGRLSTAYKLAGIPVDRRGYPIPANKINTELEAV